MSSARTMAHALIMPCAAPGTGGVAPGAVTGSYTSRSLTGPRRNACRTLMSSPFQSPAWIGMMLCCDAELCAGSVSWADCSSKTRQESHPPKEMRQGNNERPFVIPVSNGWVPASLIRPEGGSYDRKRENSTVFTRYNSIPLSWASFLYCIKTMPPSL
jgi:hypothetical protein